ncbi:hypothetical protein CHLRE_04g220076v5 [Chlamydomonas reinhardtii]|uniref:Uncharacterized protein n=1 Tax=Chlamydomonas reinhardtii TaxID=3055 RepID=A0A2K3DU61_CHLRE|nr:uncharacterized protein CHLRE_04g220076v5 [Chlamydomonas reinhardtii]PNW84076.1 hypothetical protein CHLRE_04g220076v5 [Chlamydomonas reinhardtii]
MVLCAEKLPSHLRQRTWMGATPFAFQCKGGQLDRPSAAAVLRMLSPVLSQYHTQARLWGLQSYACVSQQASMVVPAKEAGLCLVLALSRKNRSEVLNGASWVLSL